MDVLASLAAIVVAYLIGSLSFGVIFSRLLGLADPRSYGSGNPGATNVLRSGHKTAAILTLVFDTLKGFVPVMLVLLFGERAGLGQATAAWVGLATFVGHVWPAFFHFKGGKGVATAAGVLMALNPMLAVATLASFALILAFFRYVSLASIVAAVFAPFYQMLIWDGGVLLLAIVPMCLILVWRHEGNIRKLLAGTESKLGQKVAQPAASAQPARTPHARKAHGHRPKRKH
jgi:glycerol-3-phosphate acyltransferase PlsY